MKAPGLAVMLALASWTQLAPDASQIVLREDGSIALPLFPGGSPQENAVLHFGLPAGSPEKMWRDGAILHGTWMKSGVRYSQTVALIDAVLHPAGSQNSASVTQVLLVNLAGENTAAEYSDATASFALETGGVAQPLELKNGFVWRQAQPDNRCVGALDISESGIKVGQGTVLQFAGAMPPSIKGAMTLKLALQQIESSGALEQLQDLEFDQELQRLRKSTRPSHLEPSRLQLVLAREAHASEALPPPVAPVLRSAPAWLGTAPPLPAPRGPVRRVQTADELIHAVDNLPPGGTILVADGQYRLPRVLVLAQKQGVTIRGENGDPAKVTLLGKGWDHGAEHDDLLHIGRCDGVTIADLTFADCRSYGVKVEAEHGPTDIHIYHCRFKDIGVRALKGSASQDPNVRAVRGSVQFCHFENTKVPPEDWLFRGDYISAIDMMALENWTFQDNLFRHIRGRHGGGRAAIFIWVRSRGIIVERNLIINCDRGVAFGNPGQSTANRGDEPLSYVSQGIIRNNMIAGGADCGIELWHAQDIQVLHNSIWRPEQNWERGIRVGTGTRGATLRHNLIHGQIKLEGGEADSEPNQAGNLEQYFTNPRSGDLTLATGMAAGVPRGARLAEASEDIRRSTRSERTAFGAWESSEAPER